MSINIRSAISTNRRNTMLIILFFAVLLAALGYLLGFFLGSPTLGLIIAVIIAIIYSLIGYYSGDAMVLRSVNAKEVTTDTRDLKLRQYYNTVEEVSIASGTPMPRVWLIESPALNAFATGRDPKHSHVAMTRGLLDKLNREEVKGVVAHEVAHIKHQDIRLLLITSVIIGTILVLAEIMLRATFFSGGRRDKGHIWLIVIGVVFAILAPILAHMARLALSRQREYMADAAAAHMTRYPEGLASALEKIGKDTQTLRGASSLTSEMFIKNPVRQSWVNRMFSTHPPIDERIKRLRAM